MNIYILQHVPFEKPGILEALEAKVIKLYEPNYRLPNVADIDLLIILGGPMSVNDDIEWLSQEKNLIKSMIEYNKPILGICLGAQSIASVLGSTIFQNKEGKEVGFGEIQKATNQYDFLPEKLDVLHWHGETFNLPEGATRLYRSEYCENQAFIYNDNVIGLQFHMETTEKTLKDIVEADSAYIEDNVLGNTEQSIINYDIPSQNRDILMKMIEYIM
ncbi:putative glutamine amidotransferase class-I [Staphylococcus petrasii]|uniref:Putative glutamine amidotransferase class-I n=1 Tax=Staphylococcus petrasii TaxID=1276936 RepID=A0A380FUM9_9STAP|nr:type 1 glutamine amidotransferase [Staphylococcus petrasii]PNZ29206.1 GMP synthase [Staphylococcus petrasii]TGE12113.1 type 1 glutamine amidotransferase [Staphylococcus petrasii]TGE15867.1 type 1 glutamine amidotransferase [Staphylococcus petrasii]SUM42589.1 putative glutamine amidotransferase class-I [Staphylococcus petrasii]